MKTESILVQDATLLRKSVERRILDGVFWLSLVKILGQIISWTITVYVIRILSPNDYGLMAMANVYLSFIMLFSELGLGAAVIQQKELTEDDISNIGWAVLTVNLSLYLLCLLLAPAIASFYTEPQLVDVIRVASTVFIIRSLGLVSNCLLVRDMAFNRQSQAEMVGNTVGAISILSLAANGFAVWSLVYGTLVLEITKNLLFVYFHPWRIKLAFSSGKIKRMIQFGARVAVARFLWYLSSNADLLIAGKLLGKTQLGYYAIAVQFATIPLDKFVSSISQVAFPALSKFQDDLVLMRRYYLRIVNFIAVVTFPVCLGIFLVAHSAVPLVLSDKWLPAILPLQILSMITAFRAMHVMNAPMEMAVGKPGITVRNFAIIAAVMGSSFFIGSSYGLVGLAYSWLAFPVVFLVTTSRSLSLLGLTLSNYIKELRHPFLATTGMTAMVLLIQNTALINSGLVTHTAASAGVGLTAYLLYFSVFNREIFADARSLLKR